jgi:hypothetical protein
MTNEQRPTLGTFTVHYHGAGQISVNSEHSIICAIDGASAYYAAETRQNAGLIAESLNVYTETNLTPRQLVDRCAALETALNGIIADCARDLPAWRVEESRAALAGTALPTPQPDVNAELLAACEAALPVFDGTELNEDMHNLRIVADQLRAAIANATNKTARHAADCDCAWCRVAHDNATGTAA